MILDATYGEHVEAYVGRVPMDAVAKVHEFTIARWEYLHSKTHSVAYCVNPRLHERDHMADAEVKADFYGSDSRLLH